MNFRKTFVTTIATAGLLLGMGGGIASADTTDDVSVNYGCASSTATVDVDFVGDINVDLFAASGSATDSVVITLDLTCNFSTDFSVNASIGDFTGPYSPNPLLTNTFGGEHFLMTGGSVTAWDYPIIPLVTALPDIQTNVFQGGVVVDNGVIEDENIFFWPWLASPGITEATWDSSVHLLPLNLVPGNYTAPLTVDLVVN